MRQEILKFCMEKGLLLDKEALNLFSDFDNETAKKIIDKISSLKERVITKSFLTKNVGKIQNLIEDEKIIDKLKINFGVSVEISRERYIEKQGADFGGLGNLKIIYSLANLTKKLEPADFVHYFRGRYNEVKGLLQDRKELENLSSVNKINGQRQAVSIIGIVFDKRVTKNKNILLEIEDLSGRITVLVNKTKGDIYEKAKDIVVDDIIGIKCFGNREILFANEIVYPDAYLDEKNKIDRDEKAVFISDIHIGSTCFLENNFQKFIKWVNGEVGDDKQKQEALKVKYIFITGDSIDGVGVFPGQDVMLNIKDIKKQYEKLAEFLSLIRKDIKIIICPGQHDAVRVAEPQPFIGRDYGEALYSLNNVILVSNPAIVEIKNENGKRGMKILMYHGASMNPLINEIETLRLGKAHDNPARVIKEMLKRRHLASLHSAVSYIPIKDQDPLLIREVPDIIATGDLHKPDIDVYNNILIIASSCWQSITPFEEKVGNHPDPCKVPVLNLSTREIKILDFGDEK